MHFLTAIFKHSHVNMTDCQSVSKEFQILCSFWDNTWNSEFCSALLVFQSGDNKRRSRPTFKPRTKIMKEAKVSCCRICTATGREPVKNSRPMNSRMIISSTEELERETPWIRTMDFTRLRDSLEHGYGSPRVGQILEVIFRNGRTCFSFTVLWLVLLYSLCIATAPSSTAEFRIYGRWKGGDLEEFWPKPLNCRPGLMSDRAWPTQTLAANIYFTVWANSI